jgi:hypothetical protein
MTNKPEHRRPLPIRLLFARREIGRFAALRQQAPQPGERGSRQPSKYSLLMLIALTTIGMVAAISVIQLVEAIVSRA